MTRPSAIKSRGLVPAAVAALLLASGPAWADGVPAQGASKSAMCEGCHGIVGYRTAYPNVYQVPKLGGQQPEYLIKALHDYKSGARVHPSMRGIASTLSEQDIADLAAYYAASASADPLMTRVAHSDDATAGKQAEQTCSACHGPMGNKPISSDIPRLAGQQYEYLRQALAAYKTGSRQNPIMSAMAQPLTQREIDGFAWHYSRQSGLTTKY